MRIERLMTIAIGLAVLGTAAPAFAQRDTGYPAGSIFMSPTNPTRESAPPAKGASTSAAPRSHLANRPSNPDGAVDDCGVGSAVPSGGRPGTSTALNCMAPPSAPATR